MQSLIMLFEALGTSIDVGEDDYLRQKQHKDTIISHNDKQ